MPEPDFRTLFEESPDVLLVLLPDAPRFTMVAATRARLAITMTTREQTLGKGLFEMFPDNPDDPSATGTSNLRASLDRVLATRAPDTMAVQKYDIRAPDGTFQVRYWSPKNIPVLSTSGEVRYILHRVEDVTELVQASELGEELRDRTRQMEREVINRSRELAAAVRDLREANAKLGALDAAKTAFFSNVSHEFRTPLTLILGPIEDALARGEGLTGAELAAVHRNALRLLKLVNSLLDFSRIEAGGLITSFEPVDLAVLTAGLAGSFQSLVEGAGLGLVVDCPPLPEPVFVDRSHWEKIVLNLVSNAFKFTFEGEIAVGLSWHGDHVELSVRDTGTGIPEHELPRVFERFHRVEGARGRSFEGTGIGLALVQELTKLHGGTVSVSSALGRGTTFVVSIPTGSAHLPADRLVQARELGPGVRPALSYVSELWDPSGRSEPVLERAEPSGSGTSARGRVLVVDDNPDMREYLLRLLEPHWHVRAVKNGKEAISAVGEAPPEIVLSDIMMPEMNGIELVQALRADPRTNTIPVVLLSARSGEEAVLTGLETGADDYLVKPFSARELLARVRTIVEMTRARQAAARELEKAYRELQATQAKLVHSAKMASLGELVAGIAHEINNPLAFALAHLETVQKSLSRVEAEFGQNGLGEAEPAWRRALDRLREMNLGLERIRELVVRLRTFSRLDEGERKHASMRENVESVLTILGHRMKERIEVVTDFGEPDLVECYPSLLNQALVNLVGNAIDAIADRGVVTISTGRDGAEYVIRIADDGAGIPEAIRDRVFEPFFTTKPVGRGTGLGLSITYSIVKKHAGELELRPRPGGGTEAIVRFPLALGPALD
jgi:signal transduction histidine kinase